MTVPARRASWRIFEQHADAYDEWYDTRYGRRAERAERVLVERLLVSPSTVGSLLEVGCGTGRFTRWLAARMRAIGLDRSPAMLADARRRAPALPLVVGDAHALPFGTGAVDVVAFIATLEFLDDPEVALQEAVRVGRRAVLVLALNRWSTGGLRRRWSRHRKQTLLGQAHDYSISELRALVTRAAAGRLGRLRWACTLFPCGSGRPAALPFGNVIGMAVELTKRSVGDCQDERPALDRRRVLTGTGRRRPSPARESPSRAARPAARR